MVFPLRPSPRRGTARVTSAARAVPVCAFDARPSHGAPFGGERCKSAVDVPRMNGHAGRQTCVRDRWFCGGRAADPPQGRRSPVFLRNDVKPHAVPPPRPWHASRPSCSSCVSSKGRYGHRPSPTRAATGWFAAGVPPNAQHRRRRHPECTPKNPVCTVASGWGDATRPCKGVPPTPMLIPDAAVSEVPTGRYPKAGTSSVTRVYPEPPGRWRRAGKKARCISVDNP